MNKKINNNYKYKNIDSSTKACKGNGNNISTGKKLILICKRYNVLRILGITLLLCIICIILQTIVINKKTLVKALNPTMPYNSANVWYGYIDSSDKVNNITLDDILDNGTIVQSLLDNDDALEYLINSPDLFKEFVKHQTSIVTLSNMSFAKYKVLTNEDCIKILQDSNTTSMLEYCSIQSTPSNENYISASSYSVQEHKPMMAFDVKSMYDNTGYDASYWESQPGMPQTLMYLYSKKVNVYAFTINTLNTKYKPSKYVLQASNTNNEVDWIDIESFEDTNSTATSTTHYINKTTLGYSFWRIKVLDTFDTESEAKDKVCQIGTLRFYALEYYKDDVSKLVHYIVPGSNNVTLADIVNSDDLLNKILNNPDAVKYLLECRNDILNSFTANPKAVMAIVNNKQARLTLMQNTLWRSKLLANDGNKEELKKVSVQIPNMKSSEEAADKKDDIGNVVSSTSQVGFEDYNACDSLALENTYWKSMENDTDCYIGFAYDTPINIFDFKYIGQEMNSMPSEFSIEASNDFNTWYTLNTYTKKPSGSTDLTIDEQVNSNAKYKFWRIHIDKIYNASYATCSSLQLYGFNDDQIPNNKNLIESKIIVSKGAQEFNIEYNMQTQNNCIKSATILNTGEIINNKGTDKISFKFNVKALVKENYVIRVDLADGDYLYKTLNVIDDFYGNYNEFEKEELNIKVDNIKITNEKGYEPARMSTAVNTKLFINFDLDVLPGMYYEINPKLPYAVYKNGTQTFTVRCYYNDTWYDKQIEVNVDKYSSAASLTKANIGDYIDYDAGTWTQKDLDSMGDLYKTSSGNVDSLGFGGYTVGTSRNQDLRYKNDDNYPKWRILSFDENGDINIISTGVKEYLGCDKTSTSQDILKTLGEDRNYSMYENEFAIAGSAHPMTYNEALNITGNSNATNQDLRNIGVENYLYESSSDTKNLSVVKSDGSIAYPDAYNSKSIRIVVKLSKDLIIFNGNGTKSSPYHLGEYLKPLSSSVKQGDFIDYNIGNWTQQDINKLTSDLYDGENSPTTKNTFGGFKIGDSKSNSIDFTSDSGEKNIYSHGWRVSNVKDDNVSIISAGNTEVGNLDCGYIATADDVLSSRNWDMYIDSTYANSARCVTANDVKAVNNPINKIGIRYILNSTFGNGYGSERMYGIDANGSLIQPYDSYNGILFGIRPVVDLKQNLIIYAGDGSYEKPYKISNANLNIECADRWSGNVAEKFSSGSGTKEDPYIIKTAEEFAYFANQVNNNNTYTGKYIELATSINLNSVAFTPIGESNNISNMHYFSGNFDGKGYSIYNLNIPYYYQSYDRIGLFGWITGATISNLSVEQGTVYGRNNVGGLVGFATNSAITNCSSKNMRVQGTDSAGGLIGMLTVISSDTDPQSSIVSKCFNTSYITVSTNNVGGIIGNMITGYDGVNSGSNYSSFYISDVYNEGSVYGQNDVGGIIGNVIARYQNDTSIKNGYNTGTINGAGNVGGVIGYINTTDGWGGGSPTSIVSNFYNRGTITCKNIYKAEIVGAASSSCAKQYISESSTSVLQYLYSTTTPIYKEQPTDDSQYSNFDILVINCDKKDDLKDSEFLDTLNSKRENYCKWVQDDEGYPILDFTTGSQTSTIDAPAWNGISMSPLTLGSGTKESPYLITTPAQFAYFQNQVNIGNTYENKYINLKTSVNLNNITFKPIGNSNYQFKGNFEGNNYTIYNLNLPSDVYGGKDNVGLFGYTSNANILNINVNYGSINGTNNVGGIVGQAVNTNISGCSVKNLNINGNSFVGGICGTFSEESVVSNDVTTSNLLKCRNSSEIKGQTYVGGIIGYLITGINGNGSNKTITNVKDNYNLGNVTGDTNVAGIIGSTVIGNYNNSYIENMYNAGTIYGQSFVGGILGTANITAAGDKTVNVSISNIYNRGNVSGKNDTYEFAGNLASVIWLQGDTGEGQSIINLSHIYTINTPLYNYDNSVYAGSTRDGTLNIEDCISVPDFKVDSFISNLNNNRGNNSKWIKDKESYPTLDIIQNGELDNTQGSKITSVWDGTSAATSFAKGNGSQEDPYVIANASQFAYFVNTCNSGNSFTNEYINLNVNIDLNSADFPGITKFSGHFDGLNNKILHLKIINKNKNYLGLFVDLENAQVKNLKIQDGIMDVAYYAGALAGVAFNSEIVNCANINTKVIGNTYVGGLVGFMFSTDSKDITLDKCYNTADIKGDTLVGGIFGLLTINYSYTQIPELHGTIKITNSYNSGNITGTTSVGGLVGGINQHSGTDIVIIKNNYNRGDISSNSNMGGLTGELDANSGKCNITVSNFYNTGKIPYNSNNSSCGDAIGCAYVYNANNPLGIPVLIQHIYSNKSNIVNLINTPSSATSSDLIIKDAEKKDDLTTQEFLDLLNSQREDNLEWIKGNDNYPTLRY